MDPATALQSVRRLDREWHRHDQPGQVGGQWTHLFGGKIEANINGGFVQSFGTRSGIVATVTGEGTWCRRSATRPGSNMAAGSAPHRQGWVADIFVNGTARPAAGR